MEAVVQLTGVETKSGSNARGTWTMYLFSASDGQKYQTFDKQLGPSLQSHIGGQNLRLLYEEKSNGEFINRVVTSFEVAPAGLAPSSGGPAVGGGQTQPTQTPPTTTASSSDEKDLRIHRQTAAKVGAQLLAYFPPEQQTLTTFNAVVDELVDFFQNGRRAEPQTY